MAVKIKNLEHLDGKAVRYSTITSQFPNVFVQRKKNTGELIVTTDTDPEYGMHHIFTGGEHIAGGYGFATTNTRDDLCYVQETYRGTFKFFNDAYTYHTYAYNWSKTYLLKSYAYTLTSIYDNSYLRLTVDNTYNTVNISESIAYTLTFEEGVLHMKYNIIPKLTIVKSTGENINTLVLNKHSKTNTTTNNLQYINYTVRLNFQQSAGEYLKLSTDSIKSVILETSDGNREIYDNNRFNSVNSITDNVKQDLKGNSLNTFNVPIIYDKDTKLTIEYDIYNIKTDEVVTTMTNSINFVWVYPIYVVTTDDVNNININNTENSSYNKILVDYKNNKFIDNIKVEVKPINNRTRIFALLPKEDYVKEPKFYLSSDISKRGDLEGFMCPVSYITNFTPSIDILKNYNYYCSSYYYMDKNIRLDIAW